MCELINVLPFPYSHVFHSLNRKFYFLFARLVFVELEADSPNDFFYTNLNDVEITNLDWFLGVFIKDLHFKHY